VRLKEKEWVPLKGDELVVARATGVLRPGEKVIAVPAE
jgi:hypothetical protein